MEQQLLAPFGADERIYHILLYIYCTEECERLPPTAHKEANAKRLQEACLGTKTNLSYSSTTRTLINVLDAAPEYRSILQTEQKV